MDEKITPNFKKSEFACRCGCGFDDIDRKLVEKLQAVRDEIGNPIHITSGCRCAKQNKAEKGKTFSAHLSGFAADISCIHSTKRKILLPVLCQMFSRVGLRGSFIHVDIDPTKSQDVLWT